MIYLQLFLSFLQIGLFSFGGGYAAMPLIQEQVTEIHPWLSMSEFTDLITISQMTPGPIAVNGATFIGIKMAGIPGALVATFGCILPSCVIVGGISYPFLGTFTYLYRSVFLHPSWSRRYRRNEIMLRSSSTSMRSLVLSCRSTTMVRSLVYYV